MRTGWLTQEQLQGLRDFWAVYEAHYEGVQTATLAAAEEHPEFGPALRAMPADQREAQSARSRELMRRGVQENDWAPYEENLRAQGTAYAQIGVSFRGWYDLIKEFQRHLVPLLVEAYLATPTRLTRAIIEMQRFVDRAMVIVAEQYLDTKEKALRASETEKLRVEEASRAKSDFLAMMSHELRTPLNAIIGFSEILIDGKFGSLNERQSRYVGNVHDSGRHLLGLINDLLDLSKIEAGRLDVVRQWCPTRRIAEEAVTVLHPLADARRVSLVVDAPEDRPVPAVLADATRVKQVLYNLLSNAIKFTPPGGSVTVGFSISEDGKLLRTSVSDTGSGISPEDQARLFAPFVQLENAKTAPRSGTGLGLSLTRQLVELMAGRVGVQSAPGAGSTFFVELPIAVSEPPEPATAVPAGTAPLALIVDDDPAARELLDVALQAGGYRTIAAGSGEEAIARARAHRPDVITLDVMLPTIDGWDVLRVLGSDPETAAIPVVMVTISGDRRKAFSLGAVEHLVKPIDRRSLLSALARRSFTSRVAQHEIHVLVVDDDPQQLELIRAELEPRGFRVRTAANGREGIEAALSGKVDLLLLDLLMPDISGVEVVEALKRDERTRAIPILLITAAELTEEDRRRLNGDVEAILAKGTLETDVLLAEVARVLRRRA